jgi:hypothetical protein
VRLRLEAADGAIETRPAFGCGTRKRARRTGPMQEDSLHNDPKLRAEIMDANQAKEPKK